MNPQSLPPRSGRDAIICNTRLSPIEIPLPPGSLRTTYSRSLPAHHTNGHCAYLPSTSRLPVFRLLPTLGPATFLLPIRLPSFLGPIASLHQSLRGLNPALAAHLTPPPHLISLHIYIYRGGSGTVSPRCRSSLGLRARECSRH